MGQVEQQPGQGRALFTFVFSSDRSQVVNEKPPACPDRYAGRPDKLVFT